MVLKWICEIFSFVQILCHYFWVTCDAIGDLAFALDLVVQLRTGYLEQGLMVIYILKLILIWFLLYALHISVF